MCKLISLSLSAHVIRYIFACRSLSVLAISAEVHSMVAKTYPDMIIFHTSRDMLQTNMRRVYRISYNIARAPSEDSDRPVNASMQITAFAICLKTLWR